MHTIDNTFFEEYKRLDRLCGDMYSCQNGVSAYLTAMERKAVQGKSQVSCWDSDYSHLKHIRWVRNRIAHDSDPFQISEAEDLKFVQDFYSRIITGQDALALLRKANESGQHHQRKNVHQTKSVVRRPLTNTQHSSMSSNSEKKGLTSFFLIAFILLVIALLLFWR